MTRPEPRYPKPDKSVVPLEQSRDLEPGSEKAMLQIAFYRPEFIQLCAMLMPLIERSMKEMLLRHPPYGLGYTNYAGKTSTFDPFEMTNGPASWSRIADASVRFNDAAIYEAKYALHRSRDDLTIWRRAQAVLTELFYLDRAPDGQRHLYKWQDLALELRSNAGTTKSLVVPILKSVEGSNPQDPSVYAEKLRRRMGLVFKLANADDIAMKLMEVGLMEHTSTGRMNNGNLHPAINAALDQMGRFKPTGVLGPESLLQRGLAVLRAEPDTPTAVATMPGQRLDPQPLFETEGCPAMAHSDSDVNVIDLNARWIVEVATEKRWAPALDRGSFNNAPTTPSLT